jgi:protein-S-isoprenylcysteine O-methyltransferase Ste14
MARGLYLLFGAAAYGVFFATFLYLIAFVGNYSAVPYAVDRGAAAAMPVAAIADLILIALFGVQHSVMARAPFKAAWTRIVPPPIERSVYVLLASLCLIILFVFWQPLPPIVWSVSNAIAVDALWLLFAAGWGIVLISTFLINHFELFGLRQVWSHAGGHEIPTPAFRTPFFYRLVRHPIYAGFVLAFWAAPVMSLGHLLLAIGMTVYILIAIRHEERDLVAMFGADYEAYRDRAGMLVPKLGRKA